MRAPLTVVVPTKDRPHLLDGCLARLSADLRPEDELLVVDSASKDAEATSAVAVRYGAGVLRADVPGASLARNLGWQRARHAHVAFVDDDVQVEAGWSDALVAGLTAPGIDFVTGSLDVPADQTDHEHVISVLTDPDARTLDSDTRGLFGMSANVGVTRSALAAVGGFDPRLGPASWFGGGEDLDLFDRLVHSGYVGRYDPTIRGCHVQWRDARTYLRTHWSYGKGMGGRFGALVWRDRARARRLLGEMLRLEGIKTATTDVRERRRRSWGPPIAWRVGALAGFVVGVVRLRRPPAPWPGR